MADFNRHQQGGSHFPPLDRETYLFCWGWLRKDLGSWVGTEKFWKILAEESLCPGNFGYSFSFYLEGCLGNGWEREANSIWGPWTVGSHRPQRIGSIIVS